MASEAYNGIDVLMKAEEQAAAIVQEARQGMVFFAFYISII